ncbi:MAG TPA: DUF1156 domain-containing protein [Ktedonobacteraceae bacterium]|nr:DUF1156 domain-containing protein [Ktedonobacteraceae bacterium]
MRDKPRKKLIEISLPLDAINKAATIEKSIRHGHPSTLHLWWARRPLATCRAVLFASLIDDPSEHPELFPTLEEQDRERNRLFGLIERFVDWKNVGNEELFGQVRAEITKATNGNPPSVLDPFAGGGSIPLEAQRLGLEAHASDLNPVAVLINDESQCRYWHQCPCLFHRPRLPPTSRRRLYSHTRRVFARTAQRATRGIAQVAAWHYCSSGSSPGQHWAGNHEPPPSA